VNVALGRTTGASEFEPYQRLLHELVKVDPRLSFRASDLREATIRLHTYYDCGLNPHQSGTWEYVEWFKIEGHRLHGMLSGLKKRARWSKDGTRRSCPRGSTGQSMFAQP
jgi:hypothetical protein